jgi:hypothetical protein
MSGADVILQALRAGTRGKAVDLCDGTWQRMMSEAPLPPFADPCRDDENGRGDSKLKAAATSAVVLISPRGGDARWTYRQCLGFTSLYRQKEGTR